MSSGDSIYFLGYSGHAYMAIEVARANGLNILGYFDKSESDTNPFFLDYCGYEKDSEFTDIVKDSFVFPAIGANNVREKLHQILLTRNIKQTVLIDPSANVSSSVLIGESTLINPRAIVNSFSTIGKCCIINSGAIIEHECTVGDFSHIAPGAVLTGNVKIGHNCFIGANATIKPGVSLADNIIIGAGTVVLKDIAQKGTWVGNPAKLISRQ